MGMGDRCNVRRNPAVAVFTNTLVNTYEILVKLKISCYIYVLYIYVNIYIGYDSTVNSHLFWNRPIIIYHS